MSFASQLPEDDNPERDMRFSPVPTKEPRSFALKDLNSDGSFCLYVANGNYFRVGDRVHIGGVWFEMFRIVNMSGRYPAAILYLRST